MRVNVSPKNNCKPRRLHLWYRSENPLPLFNQAPGLWSKVGASQQRGLVPRGTDLSPTFPALPRQPFSHSPQSPGTSVLTVPGGDSEMSGPRE